MSTTATHHWPGLGIEAIHLACHLSTWNLLRASEHSRYYAIINSMNMNNQRRCRTELVAGNGLAAHAKDSIVLLRIRVLADRRIGQALHLGEKISRTATFTINGKMFAIDVCLWQPRQRQHQIYTRRERSSSNELLKRCCQDAERFQKVNRHLSFCLNN